MRPKPGGYSGSLEDLKKSLKVLGLVMVIAIALLWFFTNVLKII